MNRTPASEVGGESFTTLPPWPPADFLKNSDSFYIYSDFILDLEFDKIAFHEFS